MPAIYFELSSIVLWSFLICSNFLTWRFFFFNLILMKFFFRALIRWNSLNWLFNDFRNSSNIRSVLSSVSWNLNWYNRFVVIVSLIESNVHSFVISIQRSCNKMFVIIRFFLNLIRLLLSIQRPESRSTLFIEWYCIEIILWFDITRVQCIFHFWILNTILEKTYMQFILLDAWPFDVQKIYFRTSKYSFFHSSVQKYFRSKFWNVNWTLFDSRRERFRFIICSIMLKSSKMMLYTKLISSWFKRFLMFLKNLTCLSFSLNTYNLKILSLCSTSIVISIFKIRNSVSLKITVMFISSDLFHRFNKIKFTFALLCRSTLNITIVVSANFLLHSYFRWSS